MPYNAFTLDEVKRTLGVKTREDLDLFATVSAVPVSALLTETLRETAPLGLAISTEKARSELIVTPVLVEVRRQLGRSVSLFSGVDFTVDASRGLAGTCDWIFSRSPEQLVVEAPVIAIVEAKKDDLKAGLAQCLAETVAARIFNEQRGHTQGPVYGVVTTGSNWKFLRLVGDEATIDLAEYYLREVDRVVGILVHMLRGV